MPDQIPQFVNELNHLLCNTDALFVCPLTFYICSISPDSKGTNSHWQKFWFLLASPALQDQDLLILFYPQNSKTIFSVGKFDNCWLFIFQTMTDLNVTITYIHVNFLKHVTNLLLKNIVLTDIGIPTISSISLLDYWAFFQNWRSVATTLSTNLLFTFLTKTTFASNFLEWASKSLTSVVSLAIYDPKLASVFKIICTSSSLLSLLRTASVWAPAIFIYMLQW